jgi:hypothetical protein
MAERYKVLPFERGAIGAFHALNQSRPSVAAHSSAGTFTLPRARLIDSTAQCRRSSRGDPQERLIPSFYAVHDLPLPDASRPGYPRCTDIDERGIIERGSLSPTARGAWWRRARSVWCGIVS